MEVRRGVHALVQVLLLDVGVPVDVDDAADFFVVHAAMPRTVGKPMGGLRR